MPLLFFINMSTGNKYRCVAFWLVSLFVGIGMWAQSIKPSTEQRPKAGKLVIHQDKEIKEIINNEKKKATPTSSTERKQKKVVNEKASTKKEKTVDSRLTENRTKPSKTSTSKTQQEVQKEVARQGGKEEAITSAPTPQTQQTTSPTTSSAISTNKPITSKEEIEMETKREAESTEATYFPQMVRQRYKARGFRIQIYTGGNTRNHRAQAQKIAQKSRQAAPELSTYIQFLSPHWVCRVGDFRQREDAERYAKKLRSAGVSRETRIIGSEVLLAR